MFSHVCSPATLPLSRRALELRLKWVVLISYARVFETVLVTLSYFFVLNVHFELAKSLCLYWFVLSSPYEHRMQRAIVHDKILVWVEKKTFLSLNNINKIKIFLIVFSSFLNIYYSTCNLNRNLIVIFLFTFSSTVFRWENVHLKWDTSDN